MTRIAWIGPLIDRLVAAVISQRGRPPWQVVSLTFWNALGYAFFVASAWVIAHEFGIAVSVAALAWIRGLVFLGTLIPITIAGAGIREAGFVGFLSIYGVDESTALAFALALLGVQMAIGAVGGLLELASYVSKKPDPRRQPGVAHMASNKPRGRGPVVHLDRLRKAHMIQAILEITSAHRLTASTCWTSAQATATSASSSPATTGCARLT